MDNVEIGKRERILNAAAELIVRNGLQTSMAAIAETAGVAIGSLYNYFSSKDEMVAALYERLASQIAGAIVTEIDRHTSHRERLMRYVDAYIEFFWADPNRATLFEYLSSAPLLSIGERAGVFHRVTAYAETLLSEAQAAGELKDIPISLMGALVGGGIRNALKWRRVDARELNVEERRQIAQMCWDAVAA